HGDEGRAEAELGDHHQLDAWCLPRRRPHAPRVPGADSGAAGGRSVARVPRRLSLRLGYTRTTMLRVFVLTTALAGGAVVLLPAMLSAQAARTSTRSECVSSPGAGVKSRRTFCDV